MKYNVGDTICIMSNHNGHKFTIGDIVEIVEINGGYYRCKGINTGAYWWVDDDEVEGVVAEPLSEDVIKESYKKWEN